MDDIRGNYDVCMPASGRTKRCCSVRVRCLSGAGGCTVGQVGAMKLISHIPFFLSIPCHFQGEGRPT